MIETLKDLKSLLKLCRANGVTEIKLDKVELKLGDAPPVSINPDIDELEDSEVSFTEALQVPLSNEEMVQFSAGA